MDFKTLVDMHCFSDEYLADGLLHEYGFEIRPE